MKKITLLFLSIYTSVFFAQETAVITKPQIDKRVELVSIAFRLAGSNEYSSELFKRYTDRINEHYAPYKDHELIDFIKKTRQENGVSFDAVMRMAVNLDEDFKPLVDFNDRVPEVRWGEDNAYEFARLLQEFYKDSNSDLFFRKNKMLYAEAAQRFLPVYDKLDSDWYTKFYGKEPNEKFIIINGLGNGGGNYGPSVIFPDGRKEVYAIMGAWKTDDEGMVIFPVEDYFPTLVHEFNHSFVNGLQEKHSELFRNNAKIIFDEVKKEMKNGAYGSWETMINEALVRAAVIKYMKDHDFPEEQIALETSEQKNRGFIWIEGLVEELETYDRNRIKYPTLESYIPELAGAYADFAERMGEYLAESKNDKPRFVSISEFENGSTSVDPSLKQVSLNFDKAFSGANFIKPGTKEFPAFTNMKYSEDRKTVILEWKLENGKEYEFVLIGLAPQTEGERKNDEDVSIRFSTK
jgi:6-pyruvoyl-tetrahydropterin synthase